MLSILYKNAVVEADLHMQDLGDVLRETRAYSQTGKDTIMLKDLIQTYKTKMSLRGLQDGEERTLYCRILKLSTMVDEEFCALALQLKSKTAGHVSDSTGSYLSIIPHKEGVPYDLWEKCYNQYRAELAVFILVDMYAQYHCKKAALHGLLQAHKYQTWAPSWRAQESSDEYEYSSYYSSSSPPPEADEPVAAPTQQLPLTVSAGLPLVASGTPLHAPAFSSNLIGNTSNTLLNFELLNSLHASSDIRMDDRAMLFQESTESQILGALDAVTGLYTCNEFLDSHVGTLSQSKVDAMTIREEELQGHADGFLDRLALKRKQTALNAWRSRYRYFRDLEERIQHDAPGNTYLLRRTFAAMISCLCRRRRLAPIIEEFHRENQRRILVIALTSWREATQLISPYPLLLRLYRNSASAAHNQPLYPRNLTLSSGLTDTNVVESGTSFLSALGITHDAVGERENTRMTRFFQCSLRLAVFIPSLRNASTVLLNRQARGIYRAYQEALREEAYREDRPEEDIHVRNAALTTFVRTLCNVKPRLIADLLPISISSLRRNVDYLRTLEAASSHQLAIMKSALHTLQNQAHASRQAFVRKTKVLALARLRKAVQLSKLDAVADQYRRFFLIRRHFHIMCSRIHFSHTIQQVARRLNMQLQRRCFDLLRSAFCVQTTLHQKEALLALKANRHLLATTFRSLHARYVILYRVQYQHAVALREHCLMRKTFFAAISIYDHHQRGVFLHRKHCLCLVRSVFRSLLATLEMQRCRTQQAVLYYDGILLQLRDEAFRRWRWRTTDVRDLILVAGTKIATVELDYQRRAFTAWMGTVRQLHLSERYIVQMTRLRLLRTAYQELSALFSLAQRADQYGAARNSRQERKTLRSIFDSMRRTCAQNIFRRRDAETKVQCMCDERILRNVMHSIKLAIYGMHAKELSNHLLTRRVFRALQQQHRAVVSERNVEQRVNNRLNQLTAEQTERIRNNMATLLGVFTDDTKVFNPRLNAMVSERDLLFLRAYLGRWRLYAQKSSRLAKLETMVTKSVEDVSVRKAFAMWKYTLHCEKLVHEINSRVNTLTMRLVWARLVHTSFHLQYCSATLVQWTSTRLMKQALDGLRYSLFLSWRSATVSKMIFSRNARAVFVILRERLVSLQAFFNLMCTLERRVLLHVYLRQMRATFHVRAQLAQLQQREEHRSLKLGFAALKYARHVSAAEVGASLSNRQALKRTALNSWLEAYARSVQLRRDECRVSKSFNRCLLRSTFGVWLEASRHRIVLNALQARLSEIINKSLLRWAYAAMMTKARDLILNEQIIRGSRCLNIMQTALGALSEAATLQRDRHVELEKTANEFRRAALLRKCLQAGRSTLVTKQQNLAMAQQYENSLKRKELSLIFVHWREKARFLKNAERRVKPLSYSWTVPVFFTDWLFHARAILHHRRYIKKKHFHCFCRYLSAIIHMKKQMRTNNLLKQKADHLISVQNRKCMFDALHMMMDQYARRTDKNKHWLIT